MVYAKFGGQTECIMGNWKIENKTNKRTNIITRIIQQKSSLDNQSQTIVKQLHLMKYN